MIVDSYELLFACIIQYVGQGGCEACMEFGFLAVHSDLTPFLPVLFNKGDCWNALKAETLLEATLLRSHTKDTQTQTNKEGGISVLGERNDLPVGVVVVIGGVVPIGVVDVVRQGVDNVVYGVLVALFE